MRRPPRPSWPSPPPCSSAPSRPRRGDGLAPDTPNWLAGLALTWPVVELVAVRARARVEAAQLDAAGARRREVEQAVRSQIEGARAILDAARREAQNTPIALQAA